MDSELLWAALAFYGLGFFLKLPSVMRRATLTPGTILALALGALCHALSLTVAAVRMHRLPVTDVRSALSFFAFLAMMGFFFVYLRYRVTSLGIFMLPLVFVLTFIAALRPEPAFESKTFLGGWLLVHIGSTILGDAGFFLTFVAALMYLMQERELKSKRPRAFYFRLPSLEECDQLYDRSLAFGFPLLSLGILTGFVWASRTWRGLWELDPKIVASIATWLIYLVLFSTRLNGNWRGRRSAYVAIFGFAAMMATFLGVSLVSGLHGFLPNLGGTP